MLDCLRRFHRQYMVRYHGLANRTKKGTRVYILAQSMVGEGISMRALPVVLLLRERALLLLFAALALIWWAGHFARQICCSRLKGNREGGVASSPEEVNRKKLGGVGGGYKFHMPDGNRASEIPLVTLEKPVVPRHGIDACTAVVS